MSDTTYRMTLETRLGKEKEHQKLLSKAGEIGTQDTRTNRVVHPGRIDGRGWPIPKDLRRRAVGFYGLRGLAAKREAQANYG